MPGPKSRTARRVSRSAGATDTTMPVPRGVCAIALSIRIRRICATRSGSHSASTGSCARRWRSSESCCVSAGMNSALDHLHDLRQVDPLGAQLQRARLQPREVEQPRRQLAQALDLRAHLPEELPPRLLVELLVLDQLQEAADREDRRAQLVRGRRDEPFARAVELRELALHRVQRPRQLPQLVARSPPRSAR